MYLGQIVEIGPRRAVFESPQHPYTKKLMGAVPVADPARRHAKRMLAARPQHAKERPVQLEPAFLTLSRRVALAINYALRGSTAAYLFGCGVMRRYGRSAL